MSKLYSNFLYSGEYTALRWLNKAKSSQCGIIVLDLWNFIAGLFEVELGSSFASFRRGSSSCISSITSPSCQQITLGLMALTSWLINLANLEHDAPIPDDSTLTNSFLFIVIPYFSYFDCDDNPSRTDMMASDIFNTEDSICFTNALSASLSSDSISSSSFISLESCLSLIEFALSCKAGVLFLSAFLMSSNIANCSG